MKEVAGTCLFAWVWGRASGKRKMGSEEAVMMEESQTDVMTRNLGLSAEIAGTDWRN